MKERNIKISIEKAREWYSYGGELKKLALSVFTEKEIKENVLPNSSVKYRKHSNILHFFRGS